MTASKCRDVHRDIVKKLSYNNRASRQLQERSMMESAPSRTALATSLMRAVHTRRDPSPLIDDPWRDRFGERVRSGMDPEARAVALRDPGLFLDDFFLARVAYPGVIIRSRYAEDALKTATERGIRQY